MNSLARRGPEVVAASPATGVNTITGEGLAEALASAAVVVDVANSPFLEDKAVLDFFQNSDRNVLTAEASALFPSQCEDSSPKAGRFWAGRIGRLQWPVS